MTLDDLNRSYDRLLDICDALELVADGLPGRVQRPQCAGLAVEIVSILMTVNALEEQVLLPALAASTRPELRQVGTRLRQEHDVDGQAALEVQEALLALAAGQPRLSADATGYLLRSFFESVRRHVHAEQDLLILLDEISSHRGSLH